jgi:competence protein ComEC
MTPSPEYIALLVAIAAAGAMLLRYRRQATAAVLAAVALAGMGALLSAWETERMATVILDSPVTTTVTGRVVGREAVAGGRWRYVVEISATNQPTLKRPPLRVTLTAPGGEFPHDLGATISGRARLLTPSGPALVGLNDFAFDAYFAGNGAIGYFYGSPKTVQAVTADSGSYYQRFRLGLEALRGRISARIRSVLPGDTGAFAASMVTDDRRAISKDTTEALRLAGLSHIVAISGLNMALAAGLFFVGLRALLSLSQGLAHRYPIKKIAAAGALITVTGYYLISGFAVSAERAYLMTAIMLTAAIFGRPAISLRNVALSAIIILVLSPSAILGPGFQMSYAATLALVAGYSIWQRRGEGTEGTLPGIFRPLSFLWKFIFGVFLTSLIGGASTMLFSIEHFHRIAVWGLPANLLAMPVISVIVMPAGVASLVLMPIGLDWLPLQIMGVGLDLVILIAKWAASLGGDVVTGRIHTWLFVGLSICMIAMAILRSRLRFAGVVFGALLLGLNVLLPAVSNPDLVVHEDGRLAGLISGDRIATTAERPGSFIFEQWQRALPVSRLVKPVMVANSDGQQAPRRKLTEQEKQAEIDAFRADIVNPPTGRFRCREGGWCVGRGRSGTTIVVMNMRELVATACDHADLVITFARLKWSECRSGAKMLSGETLRRKGTVEIWFDPENNRQFRIMSGLGEGDRPWYTHRTYDWRSDQFQISPDQTKD